MEQAVDCVIEHYGISISNDLTLDEKLEILNKNAIKIVHVPEEEEEVEEKPAEPVKQPEPQIIYVQEPPKELNDAETIERVLSDLEKLKQKIRLDYHKKIDISPIFKKIDEIKTVESNRSNPMYLFK